MTKNLKWRGKNIPVIAGEPETEAAVMEAVEHLRGRCTLLMIAHRTSTLSGCDQVYKVQDQGLIPEVWQDQRNLKAAVY